MLILLARSPALICKLAAQFSLVWKGMRDLMLFLPIVLLFDIPSIHKTAGKQVIPAIHCRYPLFFKSIDKIDKLTNWQNDECKGKESQFTRASAGL